MRIAHAPDTGPKAERTRVAILSAAEQQFARHGYVATRLEDVAAEVGVKRAALFYHFRDKQALYDAVVADAFGLLAARLQVAFAESSPIAARVEKAVEVWVDTITARPTIARLILRHAAEADEHKKQGVFPGADELLKIAWALYEQGVESGEFKPVSGDFFHSASAVLGATVFYVAAMAPLAPGANFDPLAPEQVASHKRDALRLVRLMLGIRGRRSGRKNGGA